MEAYHMAYPPAPQIEICICQTPEEKAQFKAQLAKQKEEWDLFLAEYYANGSQLQELFEIIIDLL